MKTFEKITRPRLSQIVVEELEEAIISGTFAIGSRLPSEQSLAGQFQVSRNVIREAFKILQERGLISIVSGSGAFVAHPNSEASSGALGRYIRLIGVNSSIKSIYEARRVLEGETARLAALRADAQDMERLADCLERMRQHKGTVDKWTEADLDFHAAVAKATHNPFLSILLEPLVDQLRSVIAEGYWVPGATDTGLEAHTELYHCIEQRDPEGAYKTIHEHLYDSEKRVQAFEERREAAEKQVHQAATLPTEFNVERPTPKEERE